MGREKSNLIREFTVCVFSCVALTLHFELKNPNDFAHRVSSQSDNEDFPKSTRRTPDFKLPLPSHP